MTVVVHLATRERTIRQTGRDRTSVPKHTRINGAAHDHGFAAPHQMPSATAAAHTAGTSAVTVATMHARTNPTPTRATHEPSCLIFLHLPLSASTVHRMEPANALASRGVGLAPPTCASRPIPPRQSAS